MGVRASNYVVGATGAIWLVVVTAVIMSSLDGWPPPHWALGALIGAALATMTLLAVLNRLHAKDVKEFEALATMVNGLAGDLSGIRRALHDLRKDLHPARGVARPSAWRDQPTTALPTSGTEALAVVHPIEPTVDVVAEAMATIYRIQERLNRRAGIHGIEG